MQFVGLSGLLCSYSLGCHLMLWDTLKKSWEGDQELSWVESIITSLRLEEAVWLLNVNA